MACKRKGARDALLMEGGGEQNATRVKRLRKSVSSSNQTNVSNLLGGAGRRDQKNAAPLSETGLYVELQVEAERFMHVEQEAVHRHDSRNKCETAERSLEQLVCHEPGFARTVASYLHISDLLALGHASTSVWRALRGSALRLEELARAFSCRDLERFFGRVDSKGKQWAVAGARVSHLDAVHFFKLVRPQELRTLIISGEQATFDVSSLKACGSLETFDTGLGCSTVANLHTLQELPSLRNLYLRNVVEAVDSQHFLPRDSGNLQELSLYMSRNLISLEGVRRLTSLKVLDLGGCVKLTSIAALSPCVLLEQLSLANCSRLESISPILNGEHTCLHRLDLTGCASIDSHGMGELGSRLVLLDKLRLGKVNTATLVELMYSTTAFVRAEATSAMIQSPAHSLAPHLPQFTRHVNLSIPSETVLSTLSVLAHFAQADAGPAPSQLVEIGIVPQLAPLVRASPELRKHSILLLSKICQNRASVTQVASMGVPSLVVSTMGAILDKIEHHGAENASLLYAKQDQDALEYCASAMLFLAAAEQVREEMMGICPSAVRCLVRTLIVGSAEAVAESAGALWNLCASLQVGEVVAQCPGALKALVHVLTTGSRTARLQAAGALRNLAIVESNKAKLRGQGVLPPLIKLCRERVQLCKRNNAATEESSLLAAKVVATLRILCTDKGVLGDVGKLGIVEAQAGILLHDPDLEIVRQSCYILLALSFSPSNQKVMLKKGSVLFKALLKYLELNAGWRENEAIHAACAGILWNLAQSTAPWSSVCGARLLEALLRHMESENEELVLRVSGAVRALLVKQPALADLFVSQKGITLFVRSYMSGVAMPHCLSTLQHVACNAACLRNALYIKEFKGFLDSIEHFAKTFSATHEVGQVASQVQVQEQALALLAAVDQ